MLNGLFTIGNYVGPVFSQGRGAGRDATASACVADIIDLVRYLVITPSYHPSSTWYGAPLQPF